MFSVQQTKKSQSNTRTLYTLTNDKPTTTNVYESANASHYQTEAFASIPAKTKTVTHT